MKFPIAALTLSLHASQVFAAMPGRNFRQPRRSTAERLILVRRERVIKAAPKTFLRIFGRAALYTVRPLQAVFRFTRWDAGICAPAKLRVVGKQSVDFSRPF